MHHDLRIRKGARDIGGRIAVVGVLVRDEDVAKRVRPFGDRVQDRLRIAGRIDQRRRLAVVQKEEVAVGGMRIVRMMADVAAAAATSGCQRCAAASASFPDRAVGRGASARASSSLGTPSPRVQSAMRAGASPVALPKRFVVDLRCRSWLCAGCRRNRLRACRPLPARATGDPAAPVEARGMERLVIIGSGPAGLDRRRVRGAREPRAARLGRLSVRRPTDVDDGG